MTWARGWTLGVAIVLIPGCAAADHQQRTPSASVSVDAVDVLRVGVLEWSVEADASSVIAGTVTVMVTNTGASRHRILIDGALGEWETPLLDPGATHELEIQTSAGEILVIGCTVTGHDAHAPTELIHVAE